MGKFVIRNNYDTIKYEALTKSPFGKVLALDRVLKFYKFTYFGNVSSSEIFYDTQNNLLEKAGVILSRIQEGNRVFFKVEQLAYANKTLKTTTSKIFVHKIGLKDTIIDHAFYLTDGIKSLFATAFSIDLENIIKNAVPKITITIKSQVYKVISGTGFRALIAMENSIYKNHETKKTYNVSGMTVKNESGEIYLEEFNSFNQAIQKYCKEFIVVNDVVYEHAKNVTKKIIAPKLTKEQKEKLKEKQKKVDKF